MPSSQPNTQAAIPRGPNFRCAGTAGAAASEICGSTCAGACGNQRIDEGEECEVGVAYHAEADERAIEDIDAGVTIDRAALVGELSKP
jgi:hypothetical protein